MKFVYKELTINPAYVNRKYKRRKVPTLVEITEQTGCQEFLDWLLPSSRGRAGIVAERD